MALLDARQSRNLPASLQWLTRAAGLSSVAICAVYCIAVAALLVPWGNHPDLPFNWEEFTAAGLFHWRNEPLWRMFGLQSGLMTDSGDSPLVLIPARVGMWIGGRDLASVRVVLTALTALSVPLTWRIARDVAGHRVAWFASILLILAPAFLLYARTATNVGVTLAIATAIVAVLMQTIAEPRNLVTIGALQILLIVATWGYAPVRMLWLLALIALAVEIALRPQDRRALAIAFIVTIVALPAFLSIARQEQPLAAIEWYYFSQGEQLFELHDDPDRLRLFMGTAAEPTDATASARELLTRKFVQNVQDLASLLSGWNTSSALSDYWNPHGRFYSLILTPFLVVGLLKLLRSVQEQASSRLLLILFAGLTVPIILTTNVHIGRLIFALPIAMIIIAIGCLTVARWLSSTIMSPARANVATTAMLLAVVAGVFGLTWRSQHATPQYQYGWNALTTLRAVGSEASQTGTAVVYLSPQRWETIAARSGFYWLALDETFTVVDLHQAIAGDPSASRALLYVGDFMHEPSEWASLPGRCSKIYVVPARDLDTVLDRQAALWPGCESAPQLVPIAE